jgi:hypothetical protein
MGDGLGPDAWRDEPTYKAAFILAKLKDVLADVCREDLPDPADMTKLEWEVILRLMGASPDEIKDVQLRMGRVWR